MQGFALGLAIAIMGTAVAVFGATFFYGGRRRLLVIGGGLIVLGLLFLLALGRYQLRLAVFGEQARGTVSAAQIVRGGSAATVRFFTAAEDEISFTGATVSDDDYYSVGQVVTVRYLAANPRFAEIESWLSLWRPIVISLVLSGALILGGGLLIRRDRRRRRQG
jgi:uncharacterized membrane protein